MYFRPSYFCRFALILALAFLASNYATAQNVPQADAAQEKPTPAPSPEASPQSPAKSEKEFFLNVLDDQKAIWTSPFHLKRGDAKWIAPLGISSAVLLGTDRRTAAELAEGGGHSTRLRWSRSISRLGTVYADGGIAAAFYLYGRSRHDPRARETGLLAAEALIDEGLVTEALKFAAGRNRPLRENDDGEFFDAGSSFPSGHAATAWTLATIVAKEYPHQPLVKWSAYGLAAAVSISRYTGRSHFLSDVLVGSAIGYGIGNYVFKAHHDPSLDGEKGTELPHKHSKLMPIVAPIYSHTAHVYGVNLNWPL